jgi:energy-coupling factor transporter ATP-binding protein EcfA2
MLAHGIHDFEADRMIEAFIDARHLHGVRPGRPCAQAAQTGRVRAKRWRRSKSTISATPTGEPEIGQGLCAEGGASCVRGWRRLCAARAVRLWQDNAPQHHIRTGASFRRAHPVRRRDVTDLSTQERNIAQVFQFPVIYDTMTVYDNLAFPLRNRGVPADDVDRKVREIIGMIDLESWANSEGAGPDRRPEAEDLARPRAGAFRRQRHPVRRAADRHRPAHEVGAALQLKQLHKRFGYTMVYVTHDQTEALTFAETVVVMYEGEIVQIGTPAELFERPKHTFVGYFIGSPGMNVHAGRARRAAGEARRPDDPACPPRLGKPTGASIELGIRPEFVRIGREGMPVHDQQGRGHRPPPDRARQARGPRDRGDRRRGRRHTGRSEGVASIRRASTSTPIPGWRDGAKRRRAGA